MSRPDTSVMDTYDRVLVSGTVRPSLAFASSLRALGRVVESDFTFRPRERAAYENWLMDEYLRQLPPLSATAARELPQLLQRERTLAEKLTSIRGRADELAMGASRRLGEAYSSASRQYWSWLYESARDQWVVLDPVVTVSPETVFFEALSQDESTYARVSLPLSEIDLAQPGRVGCTNIDYSPLMDRVLARVRSYRPLTMTVTESGVSLGSGVFAAHEQKIDPPASWLRSFAEVQAVLGIPGVGITLTPSFLADVLAALQARRERNGPRALVFHLDPGAPIRIEIQPFGTVVVDHKSTYSGAETRAIKVWGRRRLELLCDLLPEAKAVTVTLLGDGMPSTWTVTRDAVQTTFVITGWTARDWSGRASFLGLLAVSASESESVLDYLKQTGSADEVEIAQRVGMTIDGARGAALTLCRQGKAAVDTSTGRFLARQFPFAVGLTGQDQFGLAERRALELLASGVVTTRVVHRSDGSTEVAGSFVDSPAIACRLTLDQDRRVAEAECSCREFGFHGLRLGPCRHLIATLGAGL